MIKDELERLIRQEIGTVRIKTDARLGIVSEALVSGNVDVVVDGRVIRTRNPYRAVKGQEVALMPDDRGGFSSALPLRPPVPVAAFEKPPFFSGGVAFLRFAAEENPFTTSETTNAWYFQDKGSRKVYRLETGIENTNWFPSQDSARFSTSGSSFALAVTQGPGGSTIIRMYSIGVELKSDGDKGDDFFALKATLVRTVTRSAGIVPVNPGDQRIFLRETWTDGGDLFWLEETEELLFASIFFIVNVKLYRLDDSGTTLLQTYTIGNPVPVDDLFIAPSIWDASQNHVFGLAIKKDGGFPDFILRRRYEITDGGNLESRNIIKAASVQDEFSASPSFYFWHGVQTSSARAVLWTKGTSISVVTEFRAFRGKGTDPIEELLFTNPVGEIAPFTRLTQKILFGKDDGFLLQRTAIREYKVKKVTVSGSNMTASSSFEELSPDETDPENLRIVEGFPTTVDVSPSFILRET